MCSDSGHVVYRPVGNKGSNWMGREQYGMAYELNINRYSYIEGKFAIDEIDSWNNQFVEFKPEWLRQPLKLMVVYNGLSTNCIFQDIFDWACAKTYFWTYETSSGYFGLPVKSTKNSKLCPCITLHDIQRQYLLLLKHVTIRIAKTF